MKFIANAEIFPSGPFGVPDGEKVVVPGGMKDILSPPYHATIHDPCRPRHPISVSGG